MFSKSLENLIGQCYKRSREMRHQYMMVEDLLLALLDDSDTAKAIKFLDGDIKKLR